MAAGYVAALPVACLRYYRHHWVVVPSVAVVAVALVVVVCVPYCVAEIAAGRALVADHFAAAAFCHCYPGQENHCCLCHGYQEN